MPASWSDRPAPAPRTTPTRCSGHIEQSLDTLLNNTRRCRDRLNAAPLGCVAPVNKQVTKARRLWRVFFLEVNATST